MIKRWLEKYRQWRKDNERRQKQQSHRIHRVLTKGKLSIAVRCESCGLESSQWDKHWCNVVRLTSLPHENAVDSLSEVR